MLSYLRNYLIENNLDAIFITNLSNVRYLTTFRGSNGQVLITREKNYFLTDFRYKIYAEQKIDKELFEVVIYNEYYKTLERLFSSYKRIGIEGQSTSINSYNKLKETFKNVEFVVINDVIESLRAIKRVDEIERIKKACEIAEKLFNIILNFIKPEIMRELDLALEIDYIAKKYLGAERMAFETIVLTSYRSAMPHGRPSNQIILNNAPLLIDFGVVYDGYCCDITRTLWIGNDVDDKFIEIYDIVKEAVKIVEENTKIGMKNKDVDLLAREFLRSFGYDDNYFGHALGHSIGIDVHEIPAFSQRANEWILKGYEVFTVEPGIYIENNFGVRIEDTVYLDREKNKIVVLSNITKELIKI
ncbi:MAG: Xaa-Pro peptidase family protein [candidate division WOR-3 bacterium]|jgi:Xaa-Pro aminopeptidase